MRLNVDGFTKACGSETFARFLSMISGGVASLGEDWTSWFSCCSCHGVACGSRPVATGHFRQYMRGLLSDRDLQDGSLSWPTAGKTSLQCELLPLHKGGFSRGGPVTLLELRTDLARFWRFALAGLASSDEVAARSFAMRLVDVFDSTSPDARDRAATALMSRAQVGGSCHALQEWAHSELPMVAFRQLRVAREAHPEEGDSGQESVCGRFVASLSFSPLASELALMIVRPWSSWRRRCRRLLPNAGTWRASTNTSSRFSLPCFTTPTPPVSCRSALIVGSQNKVTRERQAAADARCGPGVVEPRAVTEASYSRCGVGCADRRHWLVSDGFIFAFRFRPSTLGGVAVKATLKCGRRGVRVAAHQLLRFISVVDASQTCTESFVEGLALAVGSRREV